MNSFYIGQFLSEKVIKKEQLLIFFINIGNVFV